ncbi:MAG TPA: 30S ribosomal protein S12 methylthiotransferase RimO, partial [Verrucomicrobia bacterium]|nr:30S ribosomal protein S12 methylthiotransferase RimO [Verrucomicrobiota bacterium]
MTSPKTTIPPKDTVTVGMISLGCAKNLVDAEIMLGTLTKKGMVITNELEEADAVIVNTCSFIDAAQEESVDTILETAEIRNVRKRNQGLIVSGCLPQRFREKLPVLMPEVDAFMGIDQVESIDKIVTEALIRRSKRLLVSTDENSPGTTGEGKDSDSSVAGNDEPCEIEAVFDVEKRPQYIPDYSTPRIRLTPDHFTYLKIAEGCNHPCSFCIIPRMRGTHRSRRPDDIISEAQQLVQAGVRELNLISQDTTYYGLDLRPKRDRSIASPEKFTDTVNQLPADSPTLSGLIGKLDRIEGDFWVRLLYTHPAHWTDKLIDKIASSRVVAKYIDMPLQHIHSNMLERMRRETSSEYIVDLIGKIRARIPGIAIRTTFIVGFPGETESCFETLLNFIRETRFERLGIFTYSHEEGTRAYGMTDQVPDTVKQERKEAAMSLQREISSEIAGATIGKQMKVLVEQSVSASTLEKSGI